MKNELEKKKKLRMSLINESKKDGEKDENESGATTLSYEELSIFYKKFLEDRQAKHVKYSWYL